MRLYWWCAGLGGCLPLERISVAHTGDTGPGGTSAETCSPPALAITSAQVSCTDDRVTITLETTGMAGESEFFASDTANEPPWNEVHPLPAPDQADPCAATDRREFVLAAKANDATGSVYDFYQPGVGSLFGCESHFDLGPVVMTYAVAVFDPDGGFADCLVFGENPEGLIASEILLNPPTFDLSQCSIGVSSQ